MKTTTQMIYLSHGDGLQMKKLAALLSSYFIIAICFSTWFSTCLATCLATSLFRMTAICRRRVPVKQNVSEYI
jgi:hypothetical protein